MTEPANHAKTIAMTGPHSPMPPAPEENRNLIIALVLTALILFGWKFFYADPQQAAREAQQQAQAQRQAAAGEAATAREGGNAEAGRAPDAQAAGIAPGATTTLPKGREQALQASPRVSINSPRLSGSINLQGLRLDDLTLSEYQQEKEPDSPNVHLLEPRSQKGGYFAEFGWVGANVTLPDAQTRWQASHETLSPQQPVTFHWTSPEDIRFEQRIAIDDEYMFTITRRVVNQSGKALQLAPYSLINRTLNDIGQQYFVLHKGPLGVSDDVLNEYDYDELQEGKITHSQRKGWAGFTDKYWLSALVPDQGDKPFTATYQHYISDGDQRYQIDVVGKPLTIAAGGEAEYREQFFAGAKRVHLLDQYAESRNIPLFDRAVDFGSLYFLTRPIFEGLHWLHGVLGNFGLAILCLTVFIKLLLFPLANKSYSSMSQMKLLMPKMQEIRERCGDDRVKMNQEIMEMYKREGVNPASGCLPLLVQIPVFFSLYKVLFITIEMRHAPFYGWINDLSAPDPTNLFTLFGTIPWDPPSVLHVGIWPLIMAGTMIVQQRLNPKPSDPTQAQVMRFLPLMFLFVAASFPAGLVIYWSWNNTLSIIQQYLISKRYEKIYDKETGRRLKKKSR